jgi:hypothetical protein
MKMTTFKLKKTNAALVSNSLLAATLGISLIGCTSLCRPCVPRTQIQTNPDVIRNPAVKKNPCAAIKINPDKITRPVNYRPYQGNQTDLLEYGEKLYNDKSSSTNGHSCQSCHQDGNLFQPTFMQPYPHFVAMASNRTGLDQIELDEMVQLCMMTSMKAEPLMWNSRSLAALTTYTTKVQKAFQKSHLNPCRSKNPCAIRNPHGVRNPVALKNPRALLHVPMSIR